MMSNSKKGSLFMFFFFLLFIGCSEEEVSKPVNYEDSGHVKEDAVSSKEILLPDESLFAEQQEMAKALGLQHYLEVAIEGGWIADGGPSKLEISPTNSKYIFNVEGEFGANDDHPRSFPLDTRHPYFYYGGKTYRFIFEGRPPSELGLLWWNTNENAVEENVEALRFVRDTGC